MQSADLRPEGRWLFSGFLLTFLSGFGQTYFIALFAGHLKADFAITDGQFGGIYAVATLCSATLLIWAGRLADRFPVRWLGVGALSGLAVVSLAMAAAHTVWMLALALFGLRFFGQGMLTHVAMTAMGRWFNRKRGRAVSIAALGFPACEAVLPLLAVFMISLVGWRSTWTAAAAGLLLVSVPSMFALLRRDRIPAPNVPAHPDPSHPIAIRREWTRGDVLRSPLFYALLPGILAQPFIQTGLFFNQVTIVEMKGWELSWFAASFPVLAATTVVSSLATGWMVDRFGARRLLPGLLLPLGVATMALILSDDPLVLPVFMGLIGLTGGSASTLQGAIWAELYGTRHLGAIRALAVAGVVFASALSPGLIGILMDGGVTLTSQLWAMAAYCFLAALWMICLISRLNRLAAS